MTAYKNFVRDLPERCSDLFNTLEETTRFIDKDVTFLIAIASTGINIPLERLKEPTGENTPHPSRDWERYNQAKCQLAEIFEKYFLGSELWSNQPSSWCCGNIKSVEKPLDDWPELIKPTPIRSDKTIGTILKHLRNALAHGNIYTRGSDEKIKEIIFLTEVKQYSNKFKYLSVSPRDFRIFLKKWFDFIKSLELPTEHNVDSSDDYDVDLKDGTNA